MNWYFRGVPLTGAGYSKSRKISTNMTIVQARRSDNGTYVCKVLNEFYSRSAFPTLIVECKSTGSGDTYSLHCNVYMRFQIRRRSSRVLKTSTWYLTLVLMLCSGVMSLGSPDRQSPGHATAITLNFAVTVVSCRRS